MKVGIRFPLSEAKVWPLRTSSGYKIRNPRAESFKIDDELADDGGQHHRDGLRQQHQPKVAKGVSPMAKRRLLLTLWQRSDSGADELSNNAGVVERQTRDDAQQRKDASPETPNTEEEDVVGEEHHHQHRHGAEELHEDATGRPHRSQLRQTAHAQQDSADHREDDGEKGRDQGGPQSRQQVGGPGHRIDERAPLRGSELALGGKRPDQ